ncbi:SulP family inorganic anion transporter [Noviherbaspirillum saxi]|nr:SulP family inorganic anion transporter [Noviherbaspirillum saxi]
MRDAWAGLSVGLVLIPQAIAYATLAGMPPQTGLYAALLPAIVGALWGSSQLLAVGPVALTSLLVFGSLSSMATPASPQWVALAVWLALYSGLFQLLLGACRLGRVADLVSQPVVHGFINAAALIIIFSQLPDLFGVRGMSSSEIVMAAIGKGEFPAGILASAGFGIAAAFLLVLFRRLLPRFPGILFISGLAIFASWWIGYEHVGGKVVGYLPSGLPALALPPAITLEQHQALWPAAFILALISFTEAMSSCRTLARRQQTPWDENQELIGQGLAKIASGLSGAFPVSGSFSRSALNLYAGAASAWSTLFSTACVLVSLLFLLDVIYFLPRSVLAAMIIVPTFSLLDLNVFKRLFAISRDDAIVAIMTFAVTLLSMPYLYWGVFAGIGLAMASFLYRRSHPRIIEVGLHQDGTLRDRQRFGLSPLAEDLLAVRMDSALNFLTGNLLERFVSSRCTFDSDIKRVLLCASGVNDIDATGVEALDALRTTLEGRGAKLYLSAVKKQVWDVLESAGLIKAIGPECIFSTDREALVELRANSSGLKPSGSEKVF